MSDMRLSCRDASKKPPQDDSAVYLKSSKGFLLASRQAKAYRTSAKAHSPRRLQLFSYSQRSASIGFKRAAFQAGQRPKTIPTAAEIPIPTPMAHSGT